MKQLGFNFGEEEVIHTKSAQEKKILPNEFTYNVDGEPLPWEQETEEKHPE